MSWDCTVLKIKNILPIKDSDHLELVIVGNNWPVVIGKNTYKVGDMVSYFPEDSIIPDDLLESMGLTGKLSGPKKNRVKSVYLRGQLSIGVICPAPEGFNIGDSVANHYGIIRYEEPIPTEFADILVKKPDSFLTYDIDNIRGECYLDDGEECVVSIKMHGTFTGFHLSSNNTFTVSSKNQCLVKNGKSIYARVAKELDIDNKLISLRSYIKFNEIWLYGETFGKGVQDLHYGENTPRFNIFDIRIDGKYVDHDLVCLIAKILNIPTVTYIYKGPFSLEKITSLANEKETYYPCMREGVVVKPIKERIKQTGKRVINKCVSDEYLTRKGKKTEFH